MTITLTQPQPNMVSQGAIGFHDMLVDPLHDVWILNSSGQPANGDGNGWTGTGSLAMDHTNGALYIQTGPITATVWAPTSNTDTVNNAVTAHSGGGKASATPLTSKINRLSVVAVGADSVLMPPATPGKSVIIINDGVAAAQVFGQGTDTIDSVATATGVALTNAHRAIFWCTVAGAWFSLAGTKST